MRRAPPKKPDRSPRGRPLDALAREAIDLCALITARCGYSPQEAAARFQWRSGRISREVVRGEGITQRTDLPAHVLTLWHQDSGYLLASGEPRPLRERGRAPSVEALVKRVGQGLTLEVAMSWLLGTGVLRRVGATYVPRDYVVALPNNSLSQQAHNMRVFAEYLRTLDHNTRARSARERWYEASADNPRVPVSKLDRLKDSLRSAGRAFLADKDVLLHRLAEEHQPGEPTVPVAIGAYLSVGRPASVPGEARPRGGGQRTRRKRSRARS